MRRLALLLLCLSSIAGCHGFGSRASSKNRAGNSADPARVESIESMNAAEAEAHRQLNNW
jgi:hypothetical protein